MHAPARHAQIAIQLRVRDIGPVPRIRAAVRREVLRLAAQFPQITMRLKVRLFAARGGRGDLQCGCLLHARVGRAQLSVVATGVHPDAVRALRDAFYRLARGTRAALHATAGFANTPVAGTRSGGS